MKKLLTLLFALLLATPILSGQAIAADNDNGADNGAEESSENGKKKDAAGGAEPECD